jgi:hypothetical protein
MAEEMQGGQAFQVEGRASNNSEEQNGSLSGKVWLKGQDG